MASYGILRAADAGSPTATARGAANSSRPNIVLIMADDMGFSDLGCYGSEIDTPNFDALAAGGLRFTQFYNCARCCPTRASLLTGLYPHQTGIGHMTADSKLPGYRGHLLERCVTIAEALKPAGYFTAVTGKWHVGFAQEAWRPLQRGFDRFYGSPASGFYFQPKTAKQVYLNNDAVASGKAGELPKDWYSTDAWVDYGIQFIDEARARKQPFFYYLPFNAPHFPLQAPPADIAKYRHKYMAGWDRIRAERYRRQLEMGIIDKSWPISPRDAQVSQWNKVDPKRKDVMDNIMAVYAGVVDHMDRAVGRLVAALKQRGALDNTLILFLSDNGGNAEAGPWGRSGGKDLGSAQSAVWCGQSWANAENTPFRYYKHFVHEGGISSPLIVHWPAVIKQGGQITNQTGHVMDIMATCCDVSGAAYPKTCKGAAILPLEGKSLVPVFETGKREGHDAIYWEHEGNRAVRAGQWKLVARAKGGAGKWELYDVEKDRTELHDLAAQRPDLVKDLSAQWDAWAQRAFVLPKPGPKARKNDRKSGKQVGPEDLKV